MKRLLLTFVWITGLLRAQYQPVPATDYTALSDILNAKPAFASGSGAPTGSCTVGKDLYVDTVSHILYYCYATNTWGSVPAGLGFTPLNPANNLSDVSSTATSRTNLGIGTAGTLPFVTTLGNPGSNGNIPTEAAVRAAIVGGTSAGNPESCTTTDGRSICITSAPYYGSGSGATTTTTSGIFGVGTSGSIASCSTFSAGQGISIAGAGTAGNRYIGTVVSCASGALVVTPPTSTSVGGSTLVQHDETNAIQSAMTALASTGGTIYMPTGIYLVNGPLQDTSGANCVLKVPTIPGASGVNVIPITFQGFTPATLNYVNVGGSVIRTSQNTANFFGGYAPTGYFGGFTAINLRFSNMFLDSTQTNPGVTMINADHILIFQADQLSITSAATTTPTNATGLGLRMPRDANAVMQSLDHIIIRGYYSLAVIGEHVKVGHLIGTTGHNCFTFEGSDHGNSTVVQYMWHQLCDNFIVGGTQDIQVNILAADSEVAITSMVSDPDNHLKGFINWLVPYNDVRSPSTTTDPVIVGASHILFRSLAFPELTLSRPRFNPSNTGALDFVGIATAGTPGHAPAFAANGKDLVDGGSPGSLNGAVITTNDTRPTCDGTTTVTVNGVTVPVRSAIWFTQSGPGVADKIEVCMKDASDAYAWVLK